MINAAAMAEEQTTTEQGIAMLFKLNRLTMVTSTRSQIYNFDQTRLSRSKAKLSLDLDMYIHILNVHMLKHPS